jgi:Tol biopolymer transport system component
MGMRKTGLMMLASMALAVLFVSGAMMVTSYKPAQAAFPPGKNGRIVFASDRDDTAAQYVPEIYTMNPDGSDPVRLTDNYVEEFMPVWSPDGTKIAFMSYRDSYSYGQCCGNPDKGAELYVMDADGSNQKRLTYTMPEGEMSPAWSPEGTKIAFTYANNIYVMSADGSNRTNLTNGVGINYAPAWSPDGTKLMFASQRPAISSSQLYVMDADGSNPRQLTDQGHYGKPDWSPDGTKIVAIRSVDGVNQIFTMNADGTNQQVLPVYLPNTSLGAPDWSPDGTKITFVGTQTMASDIHDIYTMNADGTNVMRLTDFGTRDPSLNMDPDWGRFTYGFDGFFSPVDNLPTLNATKAGNAVPVKFGLGSDQGLDVFAADYPKSQRINCDSSAPIDSIEQTVSAGKSSLSYDALTDQYTYVWKTEKAWTGTCRQFTMKLDDGTVHQANFKLK